MVSVNVFDSFDKLKEDRVEKTLTKMEKVRQLRATSSLKNIKKKQNKVSFNG